MDAQEMKKSGVRNYFGVEVFCEGHALFSHAYAKITRLRKVVQIFITTENSMPFTLLDYCTPLLCSKIIIIGSKSRLKVKKSL